MVLAVLKSIDKDGYNEVHEYDVAEFREAIFGCWRMCSSKIKPRLRAEYG